MAGTDFLGAMEVGFGSQFQKLRNQTQAGDERVQENRLEGKLDGRWVFIDVQNVCRFAAAKGPTLW